MTDKETVRNVVVAAIEKYITLMGSECPSLAAETVPLAEVPKFDSKVSIAVTGRIAKTLNVDVPDETNLFGDKSSKYSLEKTVNLVCKLMLKKNKAA